MSGKQWIFFVYQVTDNGGLVCSSEESAIGPRFDNLLLNIGLLDWVCSIQLCFLPAFHFFSQVNNTMESQQRYFTHD